MGKIVRQGVAYCGSSDSATNIKYDNTKNVKEAIDEIKETAMFIDSFDTNIGALNTTSGSGGSSSNPIASSVTFDNTDTGLAATNVQDAVEEVNGKLSNIKTSEILWENPSPGSNFSAQNIVLSSDRYDYLKVFFRQHNVGDGGCDTQDILKGKSAILPYVTFSGGSPIICVRKIKYVDDVTLSVEAEISNGSANQGYIVPIKIIGYYL